MDIFSQILLQVILILINAFFAATEIALISINENKVKSLADDGNKKAKKLLKVIEDPTKFLSAIQIGITLAGFLGSAFAAENFAERITEAFIRGVEGAAAYAGLIESVSVILVTLVLSYFTLVLGELVPKRVAMRHKEKLATATLGIINGITTVLRPVIWFLTVSTNLILRLFRIDPNEKDETVSEEDIVVMLDAGSDEGTLDEKDVEYIKNVFKLSELTVSDVMTPRASVVAIPKDIEEAELLRVIEEEGYSRIPVYDGDLDNTVGILHTRKYLLHYRDEGFKLEDVLFEPDFIPENVHLDTVFKNMQKTHTHIVIAVDEYGSVAGVISMEDIIEEIVGDIWDEQDEVEESIIKLSDDEYSVKTAISIAEFFEFFELDEDENIDSTTVNGWVCEVSGSIPDVDFSFEYKNLLLTVTAAEEQLTREISVKRIAKEDSDEEDEEKENED